MLSLQCVICTLVQAAPPLAPTVTWPPVGAIVGSNRIDLTWTGGSHDKYEIHIGSYNTPSSTNVWNSGQVSVPQPATSAETHSLTPQQTCYVFIRLHNADGWGDWSAAGRYFYIGGELLNDPYFVAGPDGAQRAHTLCYNPTHNEYLVAYFDAKVNQKTVISYYRLDATGTKIGSEVSVVDDLEGDGGPWVCYNSARQEYLITYGGYTSSGGLHGEIRLQRVNAVTGALIGPSQWIFSAPGQMLSKVAYSSGTDSYLLVWENGGEPGTRPVYGQRLDSTAVPIGGTFHISNDTYTYAGNPSMCYNSVSDEFLVTFQVYYESAPQQDWDYFAQRVRASDGALLGPNITISATLATDNNGDVAYDSDLNRYLVVYDGGIPSPWGQFVTASGSLAGPRFPIAPVEDYRGGMSGIAWSPVTKEYLATWASCCSASNFGRRLSQSGAYLSEPFRTNGSVTGFGNWDPLAAVNTSNGEFLICWFWQYDNVYVRRYQTYAVPPPDTTAPAPVTGLSVTRYAHAVALNWTNPATQDFAGAMIRVKTSGFPSGPADGTLVVDQPNAPSTSDSFVHTGLSRGAYYYAVFAHDEVPNYASAATIQVNVLPGDFDGDGDIDQLDFAHFQICLSGVAVVYTMPCRDADLDDDGDVDGVDFTAFASCMGGSELPPGC